MGCEDGFDPTVTDEITEAEAEAEYEFEAKASALMNRKPLPEVDPIAEINLGPLACDDHRDCQSLCNCTDGICRLGVVGGPVPPPGYCDQPPVRHCAGDDDCNTDCSCRNGICSEDLLPSPLPPNRPSCFLPPPDSFEVDNTWPQWKAYTAQRQTHSFHILEDRDWIAVYFAAAGNYRFRTFNLRNGADTKIKIFDFDYPNARGPRVAVNDDIGGPWWIADSRSSRVDLQVPADSVYLIKVVNHSPAGLYERGQVYPEYDFEITQN